MVRSVQNLRAIDPGFNPDSTLTFSIGLPDNQYRTSTPPSWRIMRLSIA